MAILQITPSRYFAVIKPMSLAGVDRRGKVMLCVAWIGSVICSTPQAIIFHVESHPNITWYQQCVTFNYFTEPFHEVIYSILGMMILYAIPLVIIIFCYASIYMELYRKSRKCVTGKLIGKHLLLYSNLVEMYTFKRSKRVSLGYFPDLSHY